MYLLCYDLQVPNDNLSGPGYSWDRKYRTYKTRDALVEGLAGLLRGDDGWGAPTRRHRIYNSFPTKDCDTLIERARELSKVSYAALRYAEIRTKILAERKANDGPYFKGEDDLLEEADRLWHQMTEAEREGENRVANPWEDEAWEVAS